ncbi:MAG TPA: GNAT family N-acetyltransferase [Limnobacter sp.]|nr:GNAT family N-acetyltransferase [Limnobacter sp.]
MQKPTVTMHALTTEKLASVNAVNSQITDPQEHLYWCSDSVPFGKQLHAFASGDEPVVCWTASNHEDAVVGHLELHHNEFGWVIARVWVHAAWRRTGVARALYLCALALVFRHADTAACFCYSNNHPSKNLQKSLGFEEVPDWEHQTIDLLKLGRACFERLSMDSAQLHTEPSL